MKVKEFREMSPLELSGKLVDLKGELFNLRFQLATGQLENTSQIRSVKKDIARVRTILRETELRA
ncbi:MAG: 50S ribosomal protein L29 [Tissierellia bacterium]|jgi:large subunit ribosomal protein L29|nr:50S ribosomal protein L29 [Tissierellia bacterium]